MTGLTVADLRRDSYLLIRLRLAAYRCEPSLFGIGLPKSDFKLWLARGSRGYPRLPQLRAALVASRVGDDLHHRVLGRPNSVPASAGNRYGFHQDVHGVS